MERWRGGADAITGVGLAGYVHGSGSTFMVSATPVGHGFAVQISVPFDRTRWQAWVARALTASGDATPVLSDFGEGGAATLRVGIPRAGMTASFSVGPDGRIGPATVSLGSVQAIAECTFDDLATALTKRTDAVGSHPGVPLCQLTQTLLSGRGDRTSIGSSRDVVTELARLGDAVFTAWATARGLPLIKPHGWEVRTLGAMSARIDPSAEPSAGRHQVDTSPAWFTSGLREPADGLNVWIVAADLGGEEAPFPPERLQILAAHYAAAGPTGLRWSKHHGPAVLPLAGVLDPAISTADLLGNLSDAGFEQYLAAATATAVVPPGVAEQVRQRLNNNTLTSASALILLTGAVGVSWQPLREQVWRWLQAKPTRTVDVLDASRSLIQESGGSQRPLHREIRVAGDDITAKPIHIAWAWVVTTRHGPIASRPHVGTSPGNTLAGAATDLLARIAGLPIPVGPSEPDLPAVQALTSQSWPLSDPRVRPDSLACVLLLAARGWVGASEVRAQLMSLVSECRIACQVVRAAAAADSEWRLQREDRDREGRNLVLHLPGRRFAVPLPVGRRSAIERANEELIRQLLDAPIDSITPTAHAAARQGRQVTRETAGAVLAAAMSGRNVPPDVAAIVMKALLDDPALALRAVREQAWPKVGLVPAAVASIPLLGSSEEGDARVMGTAAVRQPDGGITACVVTGVAGSEAQNAAALRLAGSLLGIPTRDDVIPLRAATLLSQHRSAATAHSTIPAADWADLITFLVLGGELPLDARAAALTALLAPTAVDAAMSLLLNDPERLVHIELVPSGNGENQLEAQLVVKYRHRPAVIRVRSPRFWGNDAAARIWSLRTLYARALDIDGSASRSMQQRLICTAVKRPIDAKLATALVLLALDGVPLPELIEAQCFHWIAAEPRRARDVIVATGTGAVGSARCYRTGLGPLTLAGASLTRSNGTKVSVPVVIGDGSELDDQAVALPVLAKLLHQKATGSAAPAPAPPLIYAIQTALAEGHNLIETVAAWSVDDLAYLLAYSAVGGSIPATVANAIVGLAERREIAPERALQLIGNTDDPPSHANDAGLTVAVQRVAFGDMVFSSGPLEGLRHLQVKRAALTTLIARLLRVPPPDYSESLLPVAYRAARHTEYSLVMWQGRSPWQNAAAIIFGRRPDRTKRINRVHIFTANRLLEPHNARRILCASVSEFKTECTEVGFETTWQKPRYPLGVEHFTSIARATVAGVQYESPPFVEETHLRAEDLAAACLLEMIWGQQLGGPGAHALQ